MLALRRLLPDVVVDERLDGFARDETLDVRSKLAEPFSVRRGLVLLERALHNVRLGSSDSSTGCPPATRAPGLYPAAMILIRLPERAAPSAGRADAQEHRVRRGREPRPDGVENLDVRIGGRLALQNAISSHTAHSTG